MVGKLTVVTAFTALLLAPLSIATAQQFQIESMSAPELCTMVHMIKTHKAAFPGAELKDIQLHLSLRHEKCKPSDFYKIAALALVTSAKSIGAGLPPATLDRDPFPRKSEEEQLHELRAMSAPEICIIQAFGRNSGSSLGGITQSAAESMLLERAEPCNPPSFYASVASGLIIQTKLAFDKRENKAESNRDSPSNAGMIVGAMLKGYLAHKYGSSALEPYGNKPEDGTCRSDFDCGRGKSCVKAPLKSTGVCLTAVDDYGLPTLKGPDTDSLLSPVTGQCDFDVECPTSFKCDKALKVCVK